MSKLDEIKAEIDFLKDLFKIATAILVAIIAGLSKLYLDDEIGLIFYLGVGLSFFISLVLLLVFKKIRTHIRGLRTL